MNAMVTSQLNSHALTSTAFSYNEQLDDSNSFSYNGDEYREPLMLFEKTSKMPRYYQANGVNEVAQHLKSGFRRIGIKSPTGTGKTFIAKLVCLSTVVRECLGLGVHEKMVVLYVSNKHRLNRQALKEFSDCKSVELICHSAMSAIPDAVIKRGWHLTIMDECHHEAMMSVQKILAEMTTTPMVGITADDKRGDNLLLKFERFVVAITEKEAARRGFTELVGVNSFLDIGFNDKTEITCNLIRKYHHCMGNVIVFMRTEAELKRVYRFVKRELGLSAGILTKLSTEEDMDNMLDALSNGEIQFMFNCKRVAEGIDAPFITDVLLARTFDSSAEKKQYVGRSIRPDSPCSVWELVNPLVDSVAAKSVVGETKYERLLSHNSSGWSERMLSGEDLTWGRMSELRHSLGNGTPYDRHQWGHFPSEVESCNDAAELSAAA